MSGGYAGTMLRVDLTREKAETQPLPERLIRHFWGGAAINAALAFEELVPGQGPYDPGNTMIFGLGPLVGTMMPGSGKGNLTARSPLTRFFGTSGHGLFGMLKFAGFDHLLITGRARKPTVLKIRDHTVSFLDAEDLWGRDVFETTDRIWDDLGERFHVTCIGPAGENRVRDSSLITNKYAAFARTGMGAVMGSKNLKAIALYGSGGVAVADRNRFLKVAKKLFHLLRSDRNLPDWRRYGTLISQDIFTRMGLYAKKNFQSGYDLDLLDLFPLEKLIQDIKEGDVACQACPVGCKHHLDLGEGEEPRVRLAVSCMNSVLQSFGTFCLLGGWEEALRCAETCSRLGMDFMSLGNLVSFAMELSERGILTDRHTGGEPIRWGDGNAARNLIHDIAYRRGLGGILADGLDEAAKTLGEEAVPYAMHTKGLGMLYDPRVRLDSPEIFSQFTNARGYISNVSPAMVERTGEQIRRYCQKIGLPAESIERIVLEDGYDVGRLNKWAEDVTSVLEILGVCQFPPFQRLPLDLWAQAYSATTGIETSREELIRASENMWHVRRAYNLREGATHLDDTCPERFFREPVSVGNRRFPALDRQALRDRVRAYYDERGWDPETGAPPAQVLSAIGVA